MRLYFSDLMMLSEGAEAKVYMTRLYGTRIVVKVREPKAYREKSLDLMLRESRTKKEARAMHYARVAGINVPAIVALDRFSIYMEYVRGTLLKDMKRTDATIFRKTGAALAGLHSKGITHGDFTPANMLLCDERVFIIDFGLSEMSSGVEEKALDLLLMKRSVSASAYRVFEKSYLSHGGSELVISRLAEMILRGRYQTRTLLTK